MTVILEQRPLTLPHRTDLLTNLGPNWFTPVMGTGIVAVAAVSLPHQFHGLHEFALSVWVLAASLLVVASAATVIHWVVHPAHARAHLADRVIGHFYGAPPMAMLTVGAGALLVGRDLVGLHGALVIDWVLWVSGTGAGLVCAAVVPYVAFTRGTYEPAAAFGGWLMPVVPPMVSASTGALLAVHLAAGQPRETLVALCYSMFGFSLLASVTLITHIWRRLARHGIGIAAAVPTLWIVLGPLGQSITAAHGLANVAPSSAGFAVAYGLAAWGVAVIWLGIAAAITGRTLRSGLPFTLAWWSFTFPVGTVVTGTSALAARTGLGVFGWAAVALYAGLVAAWSVVLTRTAFNATRLLG